VSFDKIINVDKITKPVCQTFLVTVANIYHGDRARFLKEGYTKTGGLSPAPYARLWRGVLGPSLFPETIDFLIGGESISRCLEGLTCTLQSLLSRSAITFSSH